MIWSVCRSICRYGFLTSVAAHHDDPDAKFSRLLLAGVLALCLDEAVILLSGIDPLSIPRSKWTQSPENYINTCTCTQTYPHSSMYLPTRRNTCMATRAVTELFAFVMRVQTVTTCDVTTTFSVIVTWNYLLCILLYIIITYQAHHGWHEHLNPSLPLLPLEIFPKYSPLSSLTNSKIINPTFWHFLNSFQTLWFPFWEGFPFPKITNQWNQW